MPVLALDTSAGIAVAVVGPDGVLAARTVPEQRRHAELLAPLITEALAAAGVDRTALTAIVVGTGPAPFTGLRAGLVTARTLGLALGVPVHGVPSLDAVAAAVFDGLARPVPEVVVVTDARRREVYTARYAAGPDGDVTRVAGPAVVHPQDVVTDGAAVVGAAKTLYPDLWPDAAGDPGVDPAVLARLAAVRLAGGGALPTEPLYLRRPDVTPAAGRKRVTG